MSAKPDLLSVEGLAKRFGPTTVFENVSFSLARGELVAVLGESGVGKSTLLNCVAGLERPDAGTVRLDGEALPLADDAALAHWRRVHLGFVFQAFHVLPYLTVADNVALPLDLAAMPRAQRDGRVDEMLEAVGLAGYGSRYPRELSGGEMQRVAIARALVHRPRLLLADEPTGNLDPRTAAQVLGLLRAQVHSQGSSGVLITHSRAAAETADRILVMDGRRLVPAGDAA